MQGESVVYEGRLVSKNGFRTFIYGMDGEKKLVSSWNEYQEHIATSLWFSNEDEALRRQSEVSGQKVKKTRIRKERQNADSEAVSEAIVSID